MKKEQISDAIGMIDDEIVGTVSKTRRKKHRNKTALIMIGSAAACIGILLSTRFTPSPTSPAAPDVVQAATLAAPVYPERPVYPIYENYEKADDSFDQDAYTQALDTYTKLHHESAAYTKSLSTFFTASIQEFLTDAKGDNRIYSPINVYMALSMLAETTDGSSRQQLLDLLGADSLETLRTQAGAIWNSNYYQDEKASSILGNSLWLRNDTNYNQQTLDTLADIYYASAYSGSMGSEELDQLLQNWLNEQTKNQLTEQSKEIKLSPETVLALASSIYFKASWTTHFPKNATTSGTFHSPDGDVTCSMMNKSEQQAYYKGANYTAIAQNFNGSGQMLFVLPDEGVSLDDLLKDENTVQSLLSHNVYDSSNWRTVNLTMPKFDVASDLNLVDGLRTLGVTAIFDEKISDFSPLTDEHNEMFVSQINHAARVTVDEDGCTAAAYTVVMLEGTAITETVDFVLDRPFIFVITGADNMPLFVGVVNRPSH